MYIHTLNNSIIHVHLYKNKNDIVKMFGELKKINDLNKKDVTI